MSRKLLFISFLVVFSSAFGQQKKGKSYKIRTVAFYNLENLFDTINDVNKNDEASPIMEMKGNRSIGQTKKDSLVVAKDSVKVIQQEDLFTDKDIRLIDSLVIEAKFNSPLFDDLNRYYMPDVDTTDVTNIKLNSDTLKLRLASLDAKTPFNIAYNPALEKIIKSYLKNRSHYYPNFFARAAYYFPMIEKHLDRSIL